MVWWAIGIIMNAVISIFAFWMSMEISSTPPITIGGLIIGMLVIGALFNFLLGLVGVQMPESEKTQAVGNYYKNALAKQLSKGRGSGSQVKQIENKK